MNGVGAARNPKDGVEVAPKDGVGVARNPKDGVGVALKDGMGVARKASCKDVSIEADLVVL